MRARFGGAALAIAAFFGAGCALVLGIEDGTPRGDAGAPDATAEAAPPEAGGPDADATPDVGPPPSCKPNAPFTSIKPIAELNTSGTDQHPRLSPDEKTIWFQRVPSGYAVFTATRPDRTSAFGAATQVNELTTGGDAADPGIDPTGLRIVFASSRAGGLGNYDLWTATRPNLGSAFATPTAIAGASSSAIDHYPSFAGTGAVYFSSGRTGLGSEDVYRMSLSGSTFGAPAVVQGLSGTGYDAAPAISADELVAYIQRSFSVDGGTVDAIYASARAKTTDAWPNPTVVPELVGGGETIPGWISPDLCRLYFASDRNGNPDLWVAERTP